MAFLNPYIVFIFKTEKGYITGLTTDIDEVISGYQSRNVQARLVFQRHFDDLDNARSYQEEIKDWSDSKKESLIKGEDEGSITYKGN